MRRRHHMPLTRRTVLQGLGIAAAIGALPSKLLAASSERMKIGMIGSGNVGAALGGVWVRAGHEVMFSSRTLDNDKALAAKLGGTARAGTPRKAAAFGDIVVLSVPYRAIPEVSREIAELVKGKIIIDTCNAFEGRDGDIAAQAHEKGIGLMTAELFPDAHVVRAFNALSANTMATVHKTPGRIGMPFAGDDRSAIDVAAKLIRDIGFEPILVGGLDQGRHLRPGTPLAGEHAPERIRELVKSL
jgi:predicted dinucleotide-binding enzyme